MELLNIDIVKAASRLILGKRTAEGLQAKMSEKRTTPIVAVVGRKNSGKTTTIDYLIRRLSSRGLRVGALKHVHHADFSMDTPGTDSWRFSKAGACTVAVISPDECVLIRAAQSNSADWALRDFMRDELDVILIEGFLEQIGRRKNIYKIIAAKTMGELDSLMKSVSPPLIAITGLVAVNPRYRHYEGIPVIDIEGSGSSLVRIVRNILGEPHRGRRRISFVKRS